LYPRVYFSELLKNNAKIIEIENIVRKI